MVTVLLCRTMRRITVLRKISIKRLLIVDISINALTKVAVIILLACHGVAPPVALIIPYLTIAC